ncbi:MAG: type II toxin-antitoxin system RelE/ParE family toxin [Chromatiaceae bacterium]|jgi:toxin ParE1/3/4|nr:type II toxin-antitoxin system RelE/ParE family toxin [Chromatiaceae bacterium]
MKYEFHPEAEFEVIEAAAHYEREVPGLGVRFGDEVERVIDLLIKNPKLGAPIQEDIRHFVLRQFPFSVIYAEVGDILYVLAIAHSSRKPGYWSERSDR